MGNHPENETSTETKRSRIRESALMFTVFLMIGCIGAALEAYLLRGWLLHCMIAVLAFFSCIALLGILVLLYFVAAKSRRESWLRMAKITTGLLLLLALQVPGYLLGVWLLQNDIREAKEFCEQMIEPLEQYHQQHGSYPLDISEAIPANTTTPPILRDNYYHSNGEYFSFDFTNPGGMFSGYEYYSDERKWHEWD